MGWLCLARLVQAGGRKNLCKMAVCFRAKEDKGRFEKDEMQGVHILCAPSIVLFSDQSSSTRALLLARQKDYKLAALKAKQQGDLEKAKEYMKAGKVSTQILSADHSLCSSHVHWVPDTRGS